MPGNPPLAPGPFNKIGIKASNTGAINIAASDALLALLVESAGLVIVVVVAGISDSVANLMLVFIIGLWLLFLVMNPATVANFGNILTNIEKGAAKKK